MKHLLQLKTVMPEALSLSCSTAGLQQPLASAAKPEPQTFIDMPLLSDNGSQAVAQVALAICGALCYGDVVPLKISSQAWISPKSARTCHSPAKAASCSAGVCRTCLPSKVSWFMMCRTFGSSWLTGCWTESQLTIQHCILPATRKGQSLQVANLMRSPVRKCRQQHGLDLQGCAGLRPRLL